MGWVSPQYSRSQVKKAGKVISRDGAAPQARRDALEVVGNWKSAHSYPLNAIVMNLRKWASDVDADALVAQRIKRLPSIEAKLRRIPSLSLASMQDLGGCRVVLPSLEQVMALERKCLASRQRHHLVTEDYYIEQPKASGYRSDHLVYEYQSDRSPAWSGLTIELQLRTSLQHAWATAVETVGLFTNQALKASQGEGDWLRFFVLASSEFAAIEGTARVPGTPDDPAELRRELTALARELNVVRRLQGYSATLKLVQQELNQTDFFLLTLNIDEGRLTVRGYRDLQRAAADYAEVEGRESGSIDVVLVKTGSVAALHAAYPNYFFDTTRFIHALQNVLAS